MDREKKETKLFYCQWVDGVSGLLCNNGMNVTEAFHQL